MCLPPSATLTPQAVIKAQRHPLLQLHILLTSGAARWDGRGSGVQHQVGRKCGVSVGLVWGKGSLGEGRGDDGEMAAFDTRQEGVC